MKKELKQFAGKLTEWLCDKADAEGWGNNDVWNVTESFLLHSVVLIAADGIIPQDELRRRMEKNLRETLDEAFEQLPEFIKNMDNYDTKRRNHH